MEPFPHLASPVALGPVELRNRVALLPHGLFFAPETPTANRAMIGGMVGNNSCGANSIVYGTVRDHLVSARGFLSDGSEVTFGPLTAGYLLAMGLTKPAICVALALPAVLAAALYAQARSVE